MRKKTKLGDTIEFQRGYDLTHSQMIEGEYPVIGSNGIIGTHNTFKTSDSIVLGRSGTIGNPQIIKGKFWPHNTTLYSTDLKGNNLEYMYYLLKTLHIENYKSGSTVPTLNRNDLSPLEITIEVDTNEQKRISEILSLLDETISTNNKIISELESMAKDIYDYWFVQFDFSDENGKPYKSSGGKMVWNEELKREIPEGWKVKTLNQSYKITRGISYTSGDIATGQGVPMVNLACVDINRNYRPGELKYYNGPLSEEMKLKPGTMVIACTDLTRNRDIIGCPILIPEGNVYTFSMDMAKIESCDLEIENMYLYMTLRTDSYHSFIKHWASGTNVLHLNLDGINWYPICIPPVSLQKKLSELVLECHLKKCICLQENAELTSLRDFLLPLLMNGQVKIGDVEP